MKKGKKKSGRNFKMTQLAIDWLILQKFDGNMFHQTTTVFSFYRTHLFCTCKAASQSTQTYTTNIHAEDLSNNIQCIINAESCQTRYFTHKEAYTWQKPLGNHCCTGHLIFFHQPSILFATLFCLEWSTKPFQVQHASQYLI